MAATRDGIEDELRDALVQASYEIIAVLTAVGARHDLSLTQLRMLGVLRGREVRMAELAAFLGLDRSTVTGLVDRAGRRGLVRRIPSPAGTPDGRAVHVALTEEAERLGRDVAAEISSTIAPLAAALSAAEQHRLAGLLDRILPPGGRT